MKKMTFEEMLDILGVKLEQVDMSYRHKYNCWICKDNGVYPTADDIAIAWNKPSSEPTLRWVICNNCNYHRKSEPNGQTKQNDYKREKR